MLCRRRGVRKDSLEAIKWWRKAAEQGCADAQKELGWCYYNGIGFPKNNAEATRWYLKAAVQGDQIAQHNLCSSLYVRWPYDYDFTDGTITVLQQEAECGNKYAQFLLHDDADEASRLLATEGVPYFQLILGRRYSFYHDLPEAIKWYRRAAEQGNYEAQTELGNLFVQSAINYAEAVKWYKCAAENGFCEAQYRLGNCYYSGICVAKNYSEAIKWYRKAAEQGGQYSSFANMALGDCYYNGIGVKQNYEEAVKYYAEAAERGHRPAIAKLGDCYYNGDGVQKNIPKAIEYYEMDIDFCSFKTCNMLGDCYFNGQFVKQNYAKAVDMYLRVVGENDFKGYDDEKYKANKNLSLCYWKGLGVEKNYTDAIYCYMQSSKTGLTIYKVINRVLKWVYWGCCLSVLLGLLSHFLGGIISFIVSRRQGKTDFNWHKELWLVNETRRRDEIFGILIDLPEGILFEPLFIKKEYFTSRNGWITLIIIVITLIIRAVVYVSFFCFLVFLICEIKWDVTHHFGLF